MVGFTYNEVSRRYVDDTPEFYTPEVWRGRPQGSLKQGSDGIIDEPQFYGVDYGSSGDYDCFTDFSEGLYEGLLAQGVAPEQARMTLPQSMLTSYYVTGTEAAWKRAYKQRIDPHAQKEIQDLAKLWGELIPEIKGD